jgi:hypothetical protein
MYIKVDWFKCVSCGNTNTLFYARNDYRYGRKKMSIGGKCKLCYLDDKRAYETGYYDKNRIKLCRYKLYRKIRGKL